MLFVKYFFYHTFFEKTSLKKFEKYELEKINGSILLKKIKLGLWLV